MVFTLPYLTFKQRLLTGKTFYPHHLMEDVYLVDGKKVVDSNTDAKEGQNSTSTSKSESMTSSKKKVRSSKKNSTGTKVSSKSVVPASSSASNTNTNGKQKIPIDAHATFEKKK